MKIITQKKSIEGMVTPITSIEKDKICLIQWDGHIKEGSFHSDIQTFKSKLPNFTNFFKDTKFTKDIPSLINSK